MGWSVSKGTVEPSSYTTISSDGTLYVGLGQVAGTLTVTGTLDDATATATVTVEVENVKLNAANVKLDNSKAGTRQLTCTVGTRTVTGGTWKLTKNKSTDIASDTTISNTGLISWTRNQKSGQILAEFTKDGVTKTCDVVFSKASATVSPSTATVKNGATQKFTID